MRSGSSECLDKKAIHRIKMCMLIRVLNVNCLSMYIDESTKVVLLLKANQKSIKNWYMNFIPNGVPRSLKISQDNNEFFTSSVHLTETLIAISLPQAGF